jgi:polyisoprenoid-binding protein YceI
MYKINKNNMKTIVIIAAVILATLPAAAQRYVTKNGFIRFYSEAQMEKIEASNRQVNAAIDMNTGDFVFKVLMKSFVFEKALMQEHFNENYVESDKYPNATFVGKVTNLKDVNLAKEGIYNVEVAGKLTIHGETKEIREKGTLEVKGGAIFAKSKFNVLLSDYKISIPNTVVNNISKTIEVTVDLYLEKLNN